MQLEVTLNQPSSSTAATNCTYLHKQLDKLHNSTQTTMSSITIGNNGHEVIHFWSWILIGKKSRGSFFMLTTIMVQLSLD
jgi:hypothetical protein